MRYFAGIVLLVVTVLFVGTGCGKEVSSGEVASAQGSLDQAMKLVASGDFEAALTSADAAVSADGLDADQYVEGLLLRARCYAETGSLEQAEADVAEAEMGSPDEALLHFTRGVILSKQGKAKESKKEFSIAKRLNPKMVLK